MENTTKALIIAGAILVSIIIIGVGVLLYNSNRGTFSQGSRLGAALRGKTSDQAYDATTGTPQGFNAQFSKYFELKYSYQPISGSDTKSLVQTIIKSNQKNEHKVGGQFWPQGTTLNNGVISIDPGSENTLRRWEQVPDMIDVNHTYYVCVPRRGFNYTESFVNNIQIRYKNPN